ncbi:MAG: class I SAM-dependent methyltransferase [Clostridiales bacterium]|nr:class I SAM-dependent methyltransferase [Clostridiales bacterium]
MPSLKGLEWTFDTESEKYAKMRPGYVSELYCDIFDKIKIDENSHVLEIGIGAGQATKPILDTGCQLTAVERGHNFCDLCRNKFSGYRNFNAEECRFEDYECSDGTYDLIYSASAFHWIDEAVGYEKVYRLLRSGGVFARFANHPYPDKGRPEMSDAIQRAYSVFMPNSNKPTEYSEAEAAARADIARKYGFIDVSYKLYHRTRTFSASEYIELIGTYSDHIAIESDTRKRFYSEIEAAINDFGGQITLYDTIDLELAIKP